MADYHEPEKERLRAGGEGQDQPCTQPAPRPSGAWRRLAPPSIVALAILLVTTAGTASLLGGAGMLVSPPAASSAGKGYGAARARQLPQVSGDQSSAPPDYLLPDRRGTYIDSHWTEVNPPDWLMRKSSGCASADWSCEVQGVPELMSRAAPPRDEWEAIYEAVRTQRRGAPLDGCEEDAGPRVFAANHLAQPGLCSRLNNFATEILWAMWAGLPVSVCSSSDRWDAWRAHFATERVDFATCSGCLSDGLTVGACAGAQAGISMEDETLVDLKRFVYSKVFPWSPENSEKSSLLMKDLGLDGKYYIGVHIRRGDKGDETNGMFVGVTDFANKVRELCKATQNKTCAVYVATDDPATILELGQQLPGYEVVSQPPFSDQTLYTVRNSRIDDSSLKAQAESGFILDLALLIASDVFVGTGSSNVGRFVFFMRGASQLSISLDESGSFTNKHC